jgi:hypothetical protein
MVKSVLLGLAALMLTITVASAAEDIMSANYVMKGYREFVKLSPDELLFDQGRCAGLVQGVVQMGTTIKLTSDRIQFQFSAKDKAWLRQALCIDFPPGSTAGQVVRIVVAYIDARPARMREGFKGLALEASQRRGPANSASKPSSVAAPPSGPLP